MKVYLKIGDDPKTAKSVKGRRLLSAVSEDVPLVINKNYPVDLSKGKLNLVVVPAPGSEPGSTKLKFEYRVEGAKIIPPLPVIKAAVKKLKEEKEAESGGGANVILIAVCAVLLVLVLVCCFLYMQYRNKLNK